MQLMEKHKTVDSMVELLELYEEEDQAYGGLLEASTQLYQYLLQPFRDMRELAMLRRQQIKVIICTSLILHVFEWKYTCAQVSKEAAPQKIEKPLPYFGGFVSLKRSSGKNLFTRTSTQYTHT